MGFIPFLESRILAAFGFIPSILPISLTSKPFTLLLSAIHKKYKEFVENVQQVIDLICGDSVTYIKEIKDMTINIRGYDVQIDDEDFDRVMEHNWQVGCPSGRPYFFFGKRDNGERHYTKLHRFLVNAPKGSVVDHISGNVLDNRKCNLRITDWKGNARNHGINCNNSSGYRGVHFRAPRKSWVAQIYLEGKLIRLGHFRTPQIASIVYETATKIIFGEYYREIDFNIDSIKLPIDHIPDCKLYRTQNGYGAKIKYDGKTHYLSEYKTEVEAQLAYKRLRAEIDLKKVLEGAKGKIAELTGKKVELPVDIESTKPYEGMIKYACKRCGKIFYSKKKHAMYCSEECSGKARAEDGRYEIDHVCPCCGKRYRALPRRTYCSKSCASKANRARQLALQKGGGA
jgi:hypothetical protein